MSVALANLLTKLLPKAFKIIIIFAMLYPGNDYMIYYEPVFQSTISKTQCVHKVMYKIRILHWNFCWWALVVANTLFCLGWIVQKYGNLNKKKIKLDFYIGLYIILYYIAIYIIYYYIYYKYKIDVLYKKSIYCIVIALHIEVLYSQMSYRKSQNLPSIKIFGPLGWFL